MFIGKAFQGVESNICLLKMCLFAMRKKQKIKELYLFPLP